MHASIDLSAYLQRIGWHAHVAPDIATLQGLAEAHTSAIAFENLNPWLGLPVDLDLSAIEQKLVRDGRGGYCYEQNRLLGTALRMIGFEVTDLAARVLWNQPDDTITPLSHMLLRVTLQGQAWIVDVGFGGMTPTGALKLESGLEQSTPHEPFRLMRRDEQWMLQGQLPEGWKTLYRFDLQPQQPVDYRASNYYLSTHPESHFVTGLNVARPAPGRRLALRNREFSVHMTGGDSRRRSLHTTAELRAVLEHEFLIRLPAHPQLDAWLDGLPA